MSTRITLDKTQRPPVSNPTTLPACVTTPAAGSHHHHRRCGCLGPSAFPWDWVCQPTGLARPLGCKVAILFPPFSSRRGNIYMVLVQLVRLQGSVASGMGSLAPPISLSLDNASSPRTIPLFLASLATLCALASLSL